ncbi:MAG: hypothetical protein U1E16_05380 [Hyphomicrobiales bacterium]
MILAVLAGTIPAQAESLDCVISRGNLCFSTGCDNSGKSQRMSLDLAAGTYRLCPNRYNDEGCAEAPMQFDIRDTAIVGISKDGPEIAARAIFMNRATGALSTSLLAAGMSGVDFGTCEIPR